MIMEEEKIHASVIRRIVAYTIDVIISGFLMTPLLIWFTRGLFSDQSGIYLLGYAQFFLLGILLIRMVYLIIGWISKKGTIGCRVTHIKVTRVQETHLTITTSLLRYIGLLLCELLLGLGCITIFFTLHHQCLHDLIAKTIVIENQTPYSQN